jgi:2-methylisocitrate lyase-like PEP mutase family enzyme
VNSPTGLGATTGSPERSQALNRVAERAVELLRLHSDPRLLILVNVWDVASATTVAAMPGCRAVATASAAMAAAFGYPDGEILPIAVMLDMLARIVGAVALPVTADLEAGYGDVARTVARAIAAGAAGGNLEDRMRPLAESAKAVRIAVRAAELEGVPFVLNARTDAFLEPGSQAGALSQSLQRGQAFLEEGADCVFVPGRLDADQIRSLVEGLGPHRLSVLGLPGTPPPSELAALGVARVSYGPYPQRVALATLARTAELLLAGAPLPPL